MLVGASPENRLEIETPSSASSPSPLLARSSMTAASAGRLATSTRPSSRSYQRNAGTPAQVPCRMPCWLAGVVHGSCTVHSWSRWLPESTQRRRVGIVPDCSAHWATGKGTPSSCTKTTPSTSGSETARPFRAEPAQRDRERVVGPGGHQPGQEGADRGRDPGRGDQGPERVHLDPGEEQQREVHHDRLPGDGESADGQPADRGGHRDEHRTDRTPKTPVTAAAATRLQRRLACRPESSRSAVISARELIAHASAMRTRSETRSLARMRSVWSRREGGRHPSRVSRAHLRRAMRAWQARLGWNDAAEPSPEESAMSRTG